nr:hypothetical protein [Grapevine virus P]
MNLSEFFSCRRSLCSVSVYTISLSSSDLDFLCVQLASLGFSDIYQALRTLHLGESGLEGPAASAVLSVFLSVGVPKSSALRLGQSLFVNNSIRSAAEITDDLLACLASDFDFLPVDLCNLTWPVRVHSKNGRLSCTVLTEGKVDTRSRQGKFEIQNVKRRFSSCPCLLLEG